MHMKTISILTKAFIVLTMACAVPATAGAAQLGNLLNKAKESIQEKAKEAVQNAPKPAQVVLGEAPALPWVLDANAPAQQMSQLIASLAAMDPDKTKAFGEQISARAEYDAKLLAGMENKTILADAALKEQAEKELKQWDKFFTQLLDKSKGYGPDNMQKSASGAWFVDGPVRITVPGQGTESYVTLIQNKEIFCNKSLAPTLVNDAAVQAARVATTYNINEAWLLEGYAKGKNDTYEKEYYRATFAANTIAHAIANNKQDVVASLTPKPQTTTTGGGSGSNTKPAGNSGSSGSSGSSSNTRAASSISGSGSSVTASAGGSQVGTARVTGSNINVYTKGKSAPTGVIKSSTIDFRGTTNRYSFSKSGNDITFKGANGSTLGTVRRNTTTHKYEVRRQGSTAIVASFSDSMDPRFAALFFYKFFD